MKNFIKYFLLSSIIVASSANAGEVDVVAVKHQCNQSKICSFDVTLKHNDTSWDHYADKYDILTPNRKVLATRVLLHPHVEEQPFTRSISGVKIPAGVTSVIVRGHDKVHGYGGKELVVNLAK